MDNDKADSDVIHNDNVISIASRHNKSPSESKDVCEMSGQEIVNEIGNINLFTNSVDVIPANWYKHIINSKGYADINAIIVLAHLVYWYRPRKNGTKRFSGERLELIYAQLEKRFNLNKYLLQKALEKLEGLGIIKREYINKTVHDSKLNNVQSITLVPERVAEITELPSCKNRTTLVQNLDEDRSKFKPPSSEILPTYTYNISNINQKGMNERMRGVGVFINITKRRVDYEALSEELNADEMQYVDILVEVIAESIVGDVGDEHIKIAGDYPVRTKVMQRLLKIGKQEVLTVAKNMYRRKKCNEIADMKAYLLKALDAELNKNYPFDDTVKDICAQ